MMGDVVEFEAVRGGGAGGLRGGTGEPPLTLKERINLRGKQANRRGAYLAEAFAVWLRRELPGDYTADDLMALFYEFCSEADVIDYLGEGNDMHAFLGPEEWLPKAKPPGWIEISRRLAEQPGVTRRTLSRSEAQRSGAARKQITRVSPYEPGARKQAA